MYNKYKCVISDTKQQKESQSFLIIILLILMFVSLDSIVIGTNESELARIISRYMPIVLIAGLMCKVYLQGKHIKLHLLLLGLLMCIFMMINFLVAPGNNSINNYISQIMLVCVGVLVVSNYSFESYINSFEKIMYIAAIGSLIVYMIAFFVPIVIKQFPIITNTSGLLYYWAIVAVIPEYGMVDILWLRNTGLFREPGVYQIYLNFALSFHLFRSEKVSIKRVIIYVVTIITTTSTTGFVGLALLVCAYVIYKNPNGKKASVTWSLLVMTFIVLGMVYFEVSDKLVYSFDKLSDSTNASTYARTGSIYANLDIWLDYPIFGIGASKIITEFPIRVMMLMGIYAVDNTNTVLFMFACYGIFFGLIFTTGLWLMCRSLVKQRIVANVLFVFLFAILSGENLWYSYTPYILMMYGFLNGHKRFYPANGDEIVQNR